MKSSTGLVVALLVCALAGAGTLGCNTFRGAGKDIQRGGHAIENAADDAQYEKGHRERRWQTITAWAESGGSISPSGDTNVPYRSSRTFTVRANRGYHVADVLVDGQSVGAVSRYTFHNVTDNHSISALFATHRSR